MDGNDTDKQALNRNDTGYGQSTSTIDPIQAPPRAEPFTTQSNRQGNFARIKSFFSFSGGSILYCLSALSILFGIAQVIDPVLAESRVYIERLACIVTLNLYECILLGIMLLIVLWRRVTDDAISLLVLIALFLIVNGIALDQSVMDNIPMACVIGLVCFALAMVKMWAMRRYIALRLDTMLLTGILLLLAWNFLMSPSIALIKSLGCNNASSLRTIWQAGWLVMLAGGVLWYFQACSTPTGRNRSEHAGRPFLQTPGMSGIFAGILFVIGGLHQYELTYIFDLHFSFGDFIPLIILGILIIMELKRTYGKQPGRSEVALACVPLYLIVPTLLSGAIIAASPWGIGFLWHPTVMLGLTATAILYAGIKARYYPLVYLALVYGLIILLTAGITENTLKCFHWKSTGGVLAVLLIGIGIARRQVNVVIAGIVILSLGCGSIPWIDQLVSRHEIFSLAPAGIVAGLGVIGLYLIFGKEINESVAIIGAILLTSGTLFCFTSYVPILILTGLCAAILGYLVFRLRRNWLVSIILCIPAVTAVCKASIPMLQAAKATTCQLLPDKISGWHYVILSFILLAAGMYLSLHKGRSLPNNNRSEVSANEDRENHS